MNKIFIKIQNFSSAVTPIFILSDYLARNILYTWCGLIGLTGTLWSI